MTGLRQALEKHQVSIYFGAVTAAVAAAMVIPELELLEAAINPALAVMLLVTFLQVPLGELSRALGQIRFMAALLLANFVAIPLLVALLVQFLPRDPLLELGVLIVLLTPCIDYVVTFAHLGRADARSLLAATPLLLVVQMMLLPIYLGVLLGEAGHGLIRAGPFAFSAATRNSLVVLPLALAVPGASPVLPVVILTQTLIELVAELVYVRFIPKIRSDGVWPNEAGLNGDGSTSSKV